MKNSSGQALLVVLLVLSVALTAGLSLVARTTTDVSISKKETESNKAFEAAEAGIEEALKAIEAGLSVPDFTVDSGAQVNVGITGIGSADQPVIRSLRSGESTTFWLNYFMIDSNEFPNDGINWSGSSLNICWDDDLVERVEAAVYYQENGENKVERYYAGGEDIDCDVDGFDRGLEFSVPDGLTYNIVNVRFYDTDGNKTVRFVASGDVPLPSQGTVIVSQGEVADVSRKIQVIKGWPELPGFFDFVLFSGGNLSK